MAYTDKKPTVTKKYPIEIPTHQYFSTPCLYKVWFGKKFYLGKCKVLVTHIQSMAESIERMLRTGENPDTGWFHYIVSYIKRSRTIRGRVEIIHPDYDNNLADMLKDEQILLRRHKNDADCLNNNLDVYIPAWIPKTEVDKFNTWKNEAKKGNKNRNTAPNSRKKHKG